MRFGFGEGSPHPPPLPPSSRLKKKEKNEKHKKTDLLVGWRREGRQNQTPNELIVKGEEAGNYLLLAFFFSSIFSCLFFFSCFFLCFLFCFFSFLLFRHLCEKEEVFGDFLNLLNF